MGSKYRVKLLLRRCTGDRPGCRGYGIFKLDLAYTRFETADTREKVRFADIYNIPFLAVNKAHGTAAELSTVYNGIEIYIRALESMRISEDGNSAVMGGGVYQDQFVNFLFDHGKVSCP